MLILLFFFFNDTATTEIYTLSLHDALPISREGHTDAQDQDDPEQARETLARRAGRRLGHERSDGGRRQDRVGGDRKRVVGGKSVDLGGCRSIKKKENFDFERIEALKPAIQACGISYLFTSP